MRVSAISVAFSEMTRGFASAITLANWHDVPIVGWLYASRCAAQRPSLADLFCAFSIRNWLLPHVMRHEDALPDFFGVDAWGQTDYVS